MLNHTITAYEGSENYIFISYAHKDTDQVMPILAQLQDEGYRIWYDDGIAPGSEWPENIAQHLDGAAVAVAFISPDSMASPNCRREINFALSRQKAFLSVVLTPTEMPLGMELQLSAQQSVIRYNYRTEEQFIQKICSCPALACCREAPVQPEPEQKPAPEKPVIPPKRETPPKQEKQPRPPRPAKPPKPHKPRSSGALGKKLGIAAVAVALIVLLCVLISALNTVKLTGDLSAKKQDTYLSLRDLTVDDALLDQLSKLKKLESLTFARCTFEDGVLERWTTEAPVHYLCLDNCTGDVDLGFAAQLTELTRLDAHGCGLADGAVPALNQTGLYLITLSDNPGLTDLSMLSELEGLKQLEIANTGVESLQAVALPTLQQIDFSGTPVKDVTPLADCPELTAVTGSGSAVTDITPLTRLTQLGTLKFAGCDLSGLAPEVRFESLRMHTLDLRNTGITTLAPFSDLTQIRGAYLGYNDLNSGELQILEKSAATLKYLNLSGTGFGIADGTGDTWIARCHNLQELDLDNTRLTDLDFVREMTALTRLSACSCGLLEVSDLSGCTALTQLYLAENDMENLDGLAGMALERSDFARFDFTGCENLRDISGLPEVEYSRLCLAGCPDIDYGTAGSISGQIITLNYNATLADSHLGTDPFGNYFMLDCPGDRKVSVEELLDSYSVEFVTYGPELARVMTEELQMPCTYLTDSEED